MASFDQASVLKFIFLIACCGGLLYQGNSLFREYADTLTTELEFMEKPLTHLPGVTVCIPYIRLLKRQFIYEKLWTKDLFGEESITFSNCIKYRELLIKRDDRTQSNQSQAKDEMLDWCMDQFIRHGHYFTNNMTLEEFLGNWLGDAMETPFIRLWVKVENGEGDPWQDSSEIPYFSNLDFRVSQVLCASLGLHNSSVS